MYENNVDSGDYSERVKITSNVFPLREKGKRNNEWKVVSFSTIW